jgi:hypothetical protein
MPVLTVEEAARLAREANHTTRTTIGKTTDGIRLVGFLGTVIAVMREPRPK